MSAEHLILGEKREIGKNHEEDNDLEMSLQWADRCKRIKGSKGGKEYNLGEKKESTKQRASMNVKMRGKGYDAF